MEEHQNLWQLLEQRSQFQYGHQDNESWSHTGHLQNIFCGYAETPVLNIPLNIPIYDKYIMSYIKRLKLFSVQ